MTDYDVLFAYSEWLDSQGLVTETTKEDRRSHDELVNEFLGWKAVVS